MRLIFATLIAAATLTTLTTPALADGERGRENRHGMDRSQDDRQPHSDRDNGWENRQNRNPSNQPAPVIIAPQGTDNIYNRGQPQDNRVNDGRRGDYNGGRPSPSVTYSHNNHVQFERRHDSRQYRHDYRPDYHQNNRYGARYWGPSARQWSRWDNSWGDPQRYARQWGFDRYDHHRGWQRGNTWYASPNLWSDWGGWNWSFSWNNGGYGNYGGYSQYSDNQCLTYRGEDWINGRRAQITYVGCTDRYGRIQEQQGTRRIERWLW
jgi:hypothetical protein